MGARSGRVVRTARVGLHAVRLGVHGKGDERGAVGLALARAGRKGTCLPVRAAVKAEKAAHGMLAEEERSAPTAS